MKLNEIDRINNVPVGIYTSVNHKDTTRYKVSLITSNRSVFGTKQLKGGPSNHPVMIDLR